MILLRHQKDLNKLLTEKRKNSLSIGFVPTMGALHQGHITLMNECREQSDITVCSIFVNPTQFNNLQDYQKYPTARVNDIQMLEKARVDLIFMPSVEDLYPGGTQNLESYPIGSLESVLEGKYRPGHFQGVSQVMRRLLDAVQPDRLFMGSKDYQQCLVVEKLLAIRNIPTKLIRVNTVRETSGLAMSSRNFRLNDEQKETATVISRALRYIKENLRLGKLSDLKKHASEMIESEGLIIDYVEIVRQEDLQTLPDWDGAEPLVALAAASIGDVRLIDNLVLNESPAS